MVDTALGLAPWLTGDGATDGATGARKRKPGNSSRIAKKDKHPKAQPSRKRGKRASAKR